MDFDLSWFATVPGMFITGGVLLLIIALIILLITGKNSKKEKMAKAAVSENANVPTQQNQNVVDQVSPVSNSPVMGGIPDASTSNNVVQGDSFVNQQSVNMPMGQVPMETQFAPMPMATEPTTVTPNVVENAPVANVGVAPTVPMGEVPAVSPEVAFNAQPVEPVLPTNFVQPTEAVQPAINTQPIGVTQEVVSPIPAINFNNNQQANGMQNGFVMPEEPVPVVQPVNPASTEIAVPEVLNVPSPLDSTSVPTVSNAVAPIPPIIEPVSMVENTVPQVDVPTVQESVAVVPPSTPTPVIYGGASPAVTDFNVNQENHQIYGGADPLQNTQSIPSTIPPAVPTEPVVTEPVMISPQPSVNVVPNIVPNSEVAANSGFSQIPPIQ